MDRKIYIVELAVSLCFSLFAISLIIIDTAYTGVMIRDLHFSSRVDVPKPKLHD